MPVVREEEPKLRHGYMPGRTSHQQDASRCAKTITRARYLRPTQ